MKRLVIAAALVGAAILVTFLVKRKRPTEPALETMVVELRTGGVLLLDGRSVSFAGLQRACARKDTVELRIEERAPWAHVEWVLATLEATGVRRVRFDLPDGATDACFESDYWKQDARGLPGGHDSGIVFVGVDDLDKPDLTQRVADEAAMIRRERRLEPLGELYPETSQPFGAVVPGLRAFREAHVELEFRFEAWREGQAPDDIPLPAPAEMQLSAASVSSRCLCAPEIVVVDLPVADVAAEDKGQETDDRLMIQLDREGRVFCTGHRPHETGATLTLVDLASQLRERRERYHTKMRQIGLSGLEERVPVSKLYVLIRADRTASARQVGFLLHVLAQEGFYKVQYAVRRRAGRDLGPCVGRLDCKLEAWLPTSNLPDIVSRGEPAIDVDLGPAGDLSEVTRRLAPERRNDVVVLHVAPDVTHERLIAAVNELARAGFRKVDFAGLEPPDLATRRLGQLPR